MVFYTNLIKNGFSQQKNGFLNKKFKFLYYQEKVDSKQKKIPLRMGFFIYLIS
jgi:hypothetical protein